MADDSRPSKRIKTETSDDSGKSQDACQSNTQSSNPAGSSRTKYGSKPSSKGAQISSKPRAFSQPSVISSGDNGIFVTCDKGREKKCLLELYDLVIEHLAVVGLDEAGVSLAESSCNSSTQSRTGDSSKNVNGHSIEADIAGELAEMRAGIITENESNAPRKHMQLITLDIPCVSFLRFPRSSNLDPVDIVHTLCMNASDPSQAQRSRYIKRLTPLSNLGKVLSQGLQKACDAVLPAQFGPDTSEHIESVKFAIRPTIRNCAKLDRDEVIKLVATQIQSIGVQRHKVDLKQYEKGVIVEAYRGWIGVSVVDNTGKGRYKLGYEALRRFNLAEIYAKR